MLEFISKLDAVAFAIGPIKVYWYGLSYMLGFWIAWWLARLRGSKLVRPKNNALITDLIMYCAVGVILGGRVGYVLVYGVHYLLHDPLFIFKTWEGGMSFHGGLLGVVLALALFAYSRKLKFISLLDFVAPLVPIGIGLGRLGNFINREVWGRVTQVTWGMVFPNAGPELRHPSQLYEALIEGLLLFMILWLYSRKPKYPGRVAGMFLLGYGLGRFGCEFFREPDVQIGFVACDWLTMGQLLSLPMVLFGFYLLLRRSGLFWSNKSRHTS